jgi:hypothetical protein
VVPEYQDQAAGLRRFVVSRRAQWLTVLDAEMKRWSAMSCDQLIVELRDTRAYEVEFEGKPYQVEVELLENTDQYLHVTVSVDDGSLPTSISPSTGTFLCYKGSCG